MSASLTDATFDPALPAWGHEVLGARLLTELPPPPPLPRLGRRVIFPGEVERAEVEVRSEFLTDDPFLLPPLRIWSVPGARVVQYPRTEGLAFAADGHLLAESFGNPKALPGNPYIQMDRRAVALRRDVALAGELARAALTHDSASHNFAHFMMVMLPRIVLLDAAMTGTPFLVPDLPDYRAKANANLDPAFLLGLDAVLPLSRGNAYRPTGEGLWRVEELILLSPGRRRWNLVAHPMVLAAFDRIAAMALARKGGGAVRRPRRIYISRQGATRRRIVNHDAVEALLARHGFETVQAERLDFLDQAALFAEAEAVVAPHGAGLANLLFNDGRARVVEFYLQGEPQYHFALCATARGCRYMPQACRKVSKVNDMEVDVDALGRGLDRLLAA
jgi:capsular polysaccharide biosynthesis protein